MSALSTEQTQQELSGLAVTVQSGVFLASGLSILQGSGATMSPIVTSGAPTVTVVSGNIGVSGLFAGQSGGSKFMSGAVGFSGALPVIPLQWDYSGAQWTAFSTPISGSTVQQVWVASGNLTSIQASGAWLASGIIPNISGQAVSVSGDMVQVSGMFITWGAGPLLQSGLGNVSGVIPVATVAWDLSGGKWNPLCVTNSGLNQLNVGTVTALTTVSGLFAGQSGGTKFMSGAAAFSGAIPVIPLIWDFSGGQWVQQNCLLSGGNNVQTVPAWKRGMYMGLSGLFSTAASSVPNLSGGVALSSAICNTVTVRNLSGNTPIYLGYSGSFPASGGGAGFVLYGGDGMTVDTGPNMNLVFVVANVSGTLINHFGTFF